MKTDNISRLVGTTIEITWGTSRGRDTYGYTVCSLRYNGRLISRCNGGGYDMRGTVVGNFVTWAFAPELRLLKPSDMPQQHHYDYQTKQRVDDERSFYGLRFIDPDYNPGKAVIGEDCSDRTLADDSTGLTVEQAEEKGVSFGLERLQAAYKATAPHATERHTIPSIDGACGMSSVERIFNGLGLGLRQIVNRSKLDVYEIVAIADESSVAA
jgi:hypothetical protein